MKVLVYRTYNFIDKDPIIDQTRTVLQDVLGKEKFIGRASKLSGVSSSTLRNWFEGDTRRPQYATIAATLSAVGYDLTPKRESRIDEEAELKKAMNWIAQKRNYAIAPDRPKKKGKKAKKSA